MRVLIAYYSMTGNTETICKTLGEALAPEFQVDLFRIQMVNEYSHRLPHLNPRIIIDTTLNRKPRIKPLQDMSPYDYIIVATPNWYNRTAPPVATFIGEMTNTEEKRAIAIVSSGLAKESYADELRKRLEKKKLKVTTTLNLTLRELSESQLREIKEILTAAD